MELLAVFLPLLAFVIAFLFGKKIGDRGAQFITCSALIVAAFASISLFFDVAIGGNSYTTELSRWVSSGDFNVSWALRIDSLSVVMMCVINIVSACVHVYSVGYMGHDPCKGRFMSYLSLFTFAMLMLVSADNLLQLFFGWEGVGLASYLLIGFWNHKPSANAAAVKAFVVNRVGDFGLALAMMAIFVVFGTLQFDAIFEAVPEMAGTYFTFIGQEYHALTLIGLLLFVGAIGKSAQLGLHTWLPDAMEGPTPVSALIHAATMVTAGVFLVARMSPLYEYAPDALMVVTLVGGATAFVAATIGLTQFDIKRVIAYSTMSQLGYMFFALGVSAYGAAMFHLVTHAFFKALLFLGAGSVIHAMSDEQDMRKMGGIWKEIPMTYGLMWIGSLALAGIPPFAGFYSKDIVLEAAWADQTWFGHIAFWLGIAAAFMTAFYTWRLLIMTFHGKPRASEKVMSHVHESPAVMLGPLVILATGALLAGMVFYEPFVGGGVKHPEIAEVEIAHHEIDVEVEHDVEGIVLEDEEEIAHGMGREKFWNGAIEVRHQNDTLEAAHHVPEWVKFLPLVMGLLGIGFAYLAYLARPGIPEKIKTIFAAPYALFFNKWFFDEIYQALFVKPAFKLGQVFWYAGDQNTIDRLGPDGSAKAVKKLAGVLSRFQSGYVFQYAFVMMIAVIAIVSWFVFKIGQGY
ncbi:MAG: NADH-quinone oxidoreductase subunit L [Rhodospirillales bacterium]|nr:NADH-quinone oxidoreductase subunit L [Rhodospirillales bacterium]